MPMPYPNHLRRRLLKLIEAGANQHELARRYHVSLHFLYTIWRRKRETGSTDLRPPSRHGPLCSVSDALKKETLLMLEQHPEMLLTDVQDYWQSKGIRLGPSRVHQLVSALGWNYGRKKELMLKLYGTSNQNEVWLLVGKPERILSRPARKNIRPKDTRPKDPAQVERGRRGGKATAAKRTPQQRKEASRRAAQALWSRRRDGRP